MPSVSTWVPESEVCKSCTVSLRQHCSHGETLCGWQCAQTRETCSSTRMRRERNYRVEPLRPEECHRKPEAGHMPGSASGDPMMVMDFPSTANGVSGSERTRRNQSVDSLTHRLEGVELLNDHRDELLLQCAQSSRLLGRRGLIPTVRSSQGAGKGIQRGGERTEGAPDGTTLHVGVCSVRQ